MRQDPFIPQEEIQSTISLLVQRLKRCEAGEIIPYPVLADAAGVSPGVMDGSYYALTKAREILEKADNKVFLSVRGVGLKCASSVDLVTIAERKRTTIQRTAKKAAFHLSCVNFGELPPAEQVKHNVYASLFAMTVSATDRTAMRKVENRVKVDQDKLSRDATLRVLLGNTEKEKDS